MDTAQFDDLLHSLKSAISRRGLFVGLTAGAFATGTFDRDDADARKKSGKKRKNNNRKKRKRNKNDKAGIRLDATCPGEGESGVRHNGGDRRLAQTFTALRSGPLVKATILIRDLLDPAGDFVLRLSPVDSSGLPTNEVLAETTTAVDAASDEVVELEFAFADPFSVVADAVYALVLTRPAGNGFNWRGDLGNRCGGTVSFSEDQTTPFQSFNDDFDFTFSTFVKS